MSKKVNNSFLTTNGYETRIIKKLPKTQADRLKDNRMLASTLKRCLGVDVDYTLDDGTVINVSIGELLATKRVSYMIENPDKIDLKEISSVLGESKVEASVSSLPTDAFQGLVSVEKQEESKDDTNSK